MAPPPAPLCAALPIAPVDREVVPAPLIAPLRCQADSLLVATASRPASASELFRNLVRGFLLHRCAQMRPPVPPRDILPQLVAYRYFDIHFDLRRCAAGVVSVPMLPTMDEVLAAARILVDHGARF